MRTVYSTRGVAGDRVSLWRGVIRDVYASLEIDVAPSQQFAGDLALARLGQIEITDVKADSEIARRTRRHISRSGTNSYIYLLVRTGHLNIEQFGRRCLIGAGEFALLDLDEPYLFSHSERVHKIGLKLPKHLLHRNTSDLVRQCAVPHSASTGIARLAADYIVGLTDHDAELTSEQIHLLSRNASDLVYLSLDTEAGRPLADETPIRSAVRKRAIAFIEANCARSDLRPEIIALGIGVSVRYLHQCFEGADDTVMQHVRKIRLQRSRSDLEDPTRRREPIKQIAFRNGFLNVSHFNEVFKAEFGFTPREARARKLD